MATGTQTLARVFDAPLAGVAIGGTVVAGLAVAAGRLWLEGGVNDVSDETAAPFRQISQGNMDPVFVATVEATEERSSTRWRGGGEDSQRLPAVRPAA